MPEQHFKIIVPASTANLGPGFDVLGMALCLYNRVEVWCEGVEDCPRSIEEAVTRMEVSGEGAAFLSANRHNLLLTSAWAVFDHLGCYPRRLRLKVENDIPIGKGLGSSAAAIVGGLLLANYLTNERLSLQNLLRMATSLEGHPDNILPVMVGGIVLGLKDEAGELHYRRINPPPFWAVVAIPEYHLFTSQARKVLPEKVPLEDAIFNLSRVAYLVSSLQAGEVKDLALAMQDRLHQPYRAPLIPGLEETLEAAKKAGAYGAALSGAGPSILALVPPEKSQAVMNAMQQRLQHHGIPSRSICVPPAAKGAWIERVMA